MDHHTHQVIDILDSWCLRHTKHTVVVTSLIVVQNFEGFLQLNQRITGCITKTPHVGASLLPSGALIDRQST